MKTEAREEIGALSKEVSLCFVKKNETPGLVLTLLMQHPEWKLPKVDFKLLLRNGRILRDLDEYLKDNGDSYPDYLLEDDHLASWDGSMAEQFESSNDEQSMEQQPSWKTWDGVLKD